MLRCQRVGVADHAKQTEVLRCAVDGELGVKNFVAAVLTISLRKHHQLYVGGVALQFGEGLLQVDDFVFGQGQAKFGVGFI